MGETRPEDEAFEALEADRALLERAGVPTGPARPTRGPPPDGAAVRDAFRRVVAAARLDLTPYTAWAAALAHHWPSRFRALLGDEGPHLLATLRARIVDPDRYLKLRRIALENLATLGPPGRPAAHSSERAGPDEPSPPARGGAEGTF